MLKGLSAKIDAELRIGSFDETLSVTGASPVVDVQVTGRKWSAPIGLIELPSTGL